ncbi:hypothetical protein OH77DRAFT_1416022 [Trametes cingulata]|nr:hypothetical protein OH77DRAFT_1416022 [Trametes cingulata]
MLKHFEQSSITPYTILQRRGDAVFVPAGCAHQVSNATDCIKVACDFVSPESVSACRLLWDQFRAHRLDQRPHETGRLWPEDVLPVLNLLHHAYEWLASGLDRLTSSLIP